MKRDNIKIFQLTTELECISSMIVGLIHNDDRLNDETMNNALYGISEHINRIVKDISKLEADNYENKEKEKYDKEH